MIIKCRYCKREFDSNRQRKQHEKDAHPEGGVQFYINDAKRKVEAAPSTAQPSLVCKSCGADRLKEDCNGSRQECDIRVTAQKDGGME